VAGNSFNANFSFDYLQNGANKDNSSLVMRLNFSSKNSDYPVWKGDFWVNGNVQKCGLAFFGKCIFHGLVNFSCFEIAPLLISINTTVNNISNGTFYCYNKDINLSLNERDKVSLNITSQPALYPGKYTLSAELFYLNDTIIPLPSNLISLTFELLVKTTDVTKITSIEMYMDNKKVCTFSSSGIALSECKGIFIKKLDASVSGKNTKLSYNISIDTSKFDAGKYDVYIRAKAGNTVTATSATKTITIKKISPPKSYPAWYDYYDFFNKNKNGFNFGNLQQYFNH